MPNPGDFDMKLLRTFGLLVLSFLNAMGTVHAAAAPMVGSAAPAFKLQDQNGQWHILEEYKGKWLALYFYPKDNTPGCTTEACEFTENVFAFRDVNAVIVGISLDDTASHKEFEKTVAQKTGQQHGLPFSLLSDTTKETAKTYGVLTKMMGVMEVAQRDTFLIDPNGRIAKHYVRVDPKDHSKTVLADIRAMQAKK
jgi:thioredoxin-dependent peroxiredoxin